MKLKISRVVFCLSLMAGALVVLTGLPLSAKAAIIESGPPMDGIEEMGTTATSGPGAILPVARFMLSQSSGSNTLTAVGVYINASTTLDQGEISRVSLWRENGNQMGFQPDQDTQMAGAATTTPMVGTLLVLTPTVPIDIPVANTEFYIIATTSATSTMTNGHAFSASMDASYASTTGGGIGTAFVPNRKIILQKTASLKISELKAGATGNLADEFVELYNTSPFAINLVHLGLGLHIFDGVGAENKSLTYYKQVIPARGFFLIGSATNYSGSVPLDATYTTMSGKTLGDNGGVSIATSTVAANAVTTAIDRVGWGTQSDAAGTEGTAITNLLAGKSNERKATETSTNSSMATGGMEAYKGNGRDTNNNAEDFVLQNTPNPQNSLSGNEFPYGGGGGGDSGAPRVMGSYPMDGMTGVPIDMPFLGLGFSEMVSTSTVTTSTVTLTTGGGSNLCTTVAYDPTMMNGPQVKCNLSAQLSPSTSYTLTVTTGVQDFSSNPLDQDSFTAGNQNFTASFTTGSSGQTMTSTIPPHVTGTYPMPGSLGVPTNIAKIFVKFDQAMRTSTLTSANITMSGGVTLSSFSFDTTSNTMTAVPSALTANTNYTLTISNNVQASSTGMTLGGPSYITSFTTGTGADSSAPTILGTMPVANGAVGVPLTTSNFTFIFDDNIDMTTATSGSVTLGVVSGANIPGTVSYDPVRKEGYFTAANLLPADSNMVLTLVGASIKNVSNVALGSNYTLTFSTETENSDATPPTIMFANADEFGVAITFDEAVKATDATTLSNYSLTVGGASVSLSSMAGHTVTYDAQTRTAKLSGMHLTPSSPFVVTTASIYDLAGNQMTTSSGSGTVQTAAQSGGFLGPGDMQGDFGPQQGASFVGGGTMGGFMPPVNIRPFSTFKSASTTYGFEIPISSQIPADGSIVITFPTSADFGIGSVATTSSSYRGGSNNDINGPGPGTIGIKTITKNTTAKTVTLTLDTATRSELMGGVTDTHDFLRFDLIDIKNASVPKGPDSSGYSFDIKTKNASGVVLETLTPSPVYITGGGFGGTSTTTIRGRILGSDGGAGLNGVNVRLDSFITGPMTYTTATNVYGGEAGEYQFTDLPINNDYMIFTDPLVDPTNTATGYFGTTMPTPMRATSTSIHYKNITLTATSSAVTFTVKVTASASTFGASEKVDVFAGGPGQFTVQTVTPGAGVLSATTIATLSIPQQNGMWGIGIGPAMPKDGMFMGPPPAVTWQMPRPAEVQISGCPSACLATINGASATSYTFTISAADKTITGILKDGSGNAIANAMVFAYSPQQGFGTNAQTSSGGTFSLAVTQGTYNVGAFFPGMGQSKEVSVEVQASAVYVDGSKTASTGSTGSNPFVIVMSKPSYTITGRVTDGTNSIPNASVYTYRTDAPGRTDAMTDSSGNYTLYVDNGSWRVGSQLPGYGPMTEQLVTVSGANQTNINFAPSSSVTYYNISGTVFESDSGTIGSGGVNGVMVSARDTTSGRFYETRTGTDGAYTLRVPGSATITYALEASKPGYGRIPALNASLTAIAPFIVNNDVVEKNIRLNARQVVTINVKNSSGEMMTVPEAFIDLFDMTQNLGNHAEIRNASSTTIQIPNNSSTTIRAYIPGVPPNSITVATDDAVNTLVLNGVVRVNGSETIKVVVNTNLRTISGTIYHTSATAGNELRDVWIDIIDPTNGMHYGTQATTTGGTYSIKVSDGSYKITAMKPGYTMVPQTLTVTADNAAQNLVLTSAPLVISGTITAGGSAANGAFVRAEKVGGGFAVAKAETDGTYTLRVDSGKWRVFASSDRYVQSSYASNPVDVTASVSGINIALSTAANISTQTAMSTTFDDTSAGALHDSTLKIDVEVDATALGQTGSSAYITAQETANFTETPGNDVIGDNVKDISAYSGEAQVKNLSSGKKATIDLTYTVAELDSSGIDTPAEVANLTVAAWSEDAKQWESLSTVATYKDSDGNAVAVATSTATIPGTVAEIEFSTSEATHFSPYALVNPSDPSAPATPSGLAGTADSTTQITLTWTANTEGDLAGYYLYKDTSSSGSFPLLATISAGTNSYASTGLSANTTYYYKIAAYDTTGYESSASSAASQTTKGGGGGGTPGSISGGGGSATTLPPTTIATTTATTSSQISAISSQTFPTTSGVGTPTSSRTSVGAVSVLTKLLKLGSENSEVTALQTMLAKDPSIYPEGKITGYFGAMTRKAVRAFQKKYGIVSSGNENTTGYGLVGAKTRTKLNEVFGNQSSAVSSQSSALSNAQIQTLINNLLEQVKLLQAQLKALQ